MATFGYPQYVETKAQPGVCVVHMAHNTNHACVELIPNKDAQNSQSTLVLGTKGFHYFALFSSTKDTTVIYDTQRGDPQQDHVLFTIDHVRERDERNEERHCMKITCKRNDSLKILRPKPGAGPTEFTIFDKGGAVDGHINWREKNPILTIGNREIKFKHSHDLGNLFSPSSYVNSYEVEIQPGDDFAFICLALIAAAEFSSVRR